MTRTVRTRSTLVLASSAVALMIAAPSCRLFQAAVEAPGKVLESAEGNHGEQHVPPQVVQVDVMRFADRFDSQIIQATEEFALHVGTNEAHMQALSWSIAARTASLAIASGPNPNLNLLDMLVFVTLGRMVHDEHRVPEAQGQPDQPLIDAYHGLEADIWELAKKSLNDKQLEQMHAMIESWHAENPEQSVTTFVQLPNFERLLASGRKKDTNVFEELGNLLSLDPLAGLEPAKREVAQARLLGERTLFYAQRAPLVFSAQAELLGLRLADMPQVRGALDKADRISAAATSLATTAAGLVESVRVEREHAVQQISDELGNQRKGLMQDLQSAEAPMERLLAGVKSTADAGKEMSNAVQGAVQSLDAYTARLQDRPRIEGDAAVPGRAFDVREYGEAAARIETAAREVDGILSNIEKNKPGVEKLIDQASSATDRSVHLATRLFFIYGLILIAVAAAAALAVKLIASRLRPNPSS